MDELIIEDKKYVSSKRAAKLTGYAKDYVGQLCREGRVPARLVGRSWYVLEAAIQDHRFGTPPAEEPMRVQESLQKDSPKIDATWESPRYESSPADPLPSINRLRGDSSVRIEPGAPQLTRSEPKKAVEHLQDAWSSWFTSISQPTEISSEVAEGDVAQPTVAEASSEQSFKLEEGEVSVPIHSVYELPPEDLLPKGTLMLVSTKKKFETTRTDGKEKEDRPARQRTQRAPKYAIVLLTAAAALSSAALAILNCGIADRLIITHTRVHSISGISIYRKSL